MSATWWWKVYPCGAEVQITPVQVTRVTATTVTVLTPACGSIAGFTRRVNKRGEYYNYFGGYRAAREYAVEYAARRLRHAEESLAAARAALDTAQRLPDDAPAVKP